MELNDVIRDDIKNELVKHTTRVSWSGGSGNDGIKHIDPTGFGKLNLASLDTTDFIRSPLQFETAKGPQLKDRDGNFLPLGKYAIELGLACSAEGIDFPEIPIKISFEYIEEHDYFEDNRIIRGRETRKVLRLLKIEPLSSVSGLKKSTEVITSEKDVKSGQEKRVFYGMTPHYECDFENTTAETSVNFLFETLTRIMRTVTGVDKYDNNRRVDYQTGQVKYLDPKDGKTTQHALIVQGRKIQSIGKGDDQVIEPLKLISEMLIITVTQGVNGSLVRFDSNELPNDAFKNLVEWILADLGKVASVQVEDTTSKKVSIPKQDQTKIKIPEVPKEKRIETPKANVEKPEPKKTKSHRKLNTTIIVALIGLAGTIIAGLLSSPLIEKWFPVASVPSATSTFQAVFTPTISIVPSSATPSPSIDYTVRAGDTCSSISLTFQVSIREIITLNGSSSFCENLFVDRVIKIPDNAINPLPTLEPSPTKTQVFTPTVTSLPTEITDAKGVSMMLVPAGEFKMGNNSGDEDEKPVHTVYLDAFYIDQYEVTIGRYKECVSDGKCLSPVNNRSYERQSYYNDSTYLDYPVIFVTWEMANTYCEWRSVRLPTEAEWEKAARGSDERIYPWGNERSCDFYSCSNDTIEVGKIPENKSPYGVYDMAGNVAEWVSDLYDDQYYSVSPLRNPTGPDIGRLGNLTGIFRIARGGSSFAPYTPGGTTMRNQFDSNATVRALVNEKTYSLINIGFRCAKDANP